MYSLLATVILFETCLYCVSGLKGQYKHGIIIDAGSTGSRVFLYKIEDNDVVEVRLGTCSPGISSAPGRETFKCYQDHLTAALSLIPQEYHAQSPVYILATAGMRLLPRIDQDVIYRDIHSAYAASNLPFQLHTETISGEAEAYFSWLSVQYLSKTLLIDIHTRVAPTIGALDLG
jgi:Golgi apyrase